MAVKRYERGEHPAGFIGFRVTCYDGADQPMKQEYFSVNEYGFADAHAMAYKLDEEWRQQRDESNKNKRLCISQNSLEKIVPLPLEQMIEISAILNRSGIVSTKQMEIFLKCASREGSCLADIVDASTDSLEYKQAYVVVRKLMLGSPARKDGLELLTWGKKIYGYERSVDLTAKGFKLFQEINRTLGL